MKKIIKSLLLLSIISLQLKPFSINVMRNAVDKMNKQGTLEEGLQAFNKTAIPQIESINKSSNLTKVDFYKDVFEPVRMFINSKCKDITKDSESYTQTTSIVNDYMMQIKNAFDSKSNIKGVNTIIIPFQASLYWLSEDGWYLGEETQRILEGLRSNIERLNTEIEKTREALTAKTADISLLETQLEEARKIETITSEITQISSERDSLVIQAKALKESIQILREKNTSLREKNKELQELYKKVNDALEIAKQLNETLRQDIESLKETISENETKFKTNKATLIKAHKAQVEDINLLVDGLAEEFIEKDLKLRKLKRSGVIVGTNILLGTLLFTIYQAATYEQSAYVTESQMLSFVIRAAMMGAASGIVPGALLAGINYYFNELKRKSPKEVIETIKRRESFKSRKRREERIYTKQPKAKKGYQY